MRGRSQSWAPSSVREVLYRDLYRGVIVWNKTKKRDQWGAKRTVARPKADWIEVPEPSLQIVPPTVWEAAHARLATVRRVYLAATEGQPFGRPPLSDPSKYLLTNLALCGCCGGSLRVRSHGNSGGNRRKRFYGCSGYHERGTTVCRNGQDAPMVEADHELLETLLEDVLDPTIVREAVDEAVRLIVGARGTEEDPRERLETRDREGGAGAPAVRVGDRGRRHRLERRQLFGGTSNVILRGWPGCR